MLTDIYEVNEDFIILSCLKGPCFATMHFYNKVSFQRALVCVGVHFERT